MSTNSNMIRQENSGFSKKKFYILCSGLFLLSLIAHLLIVGLFINMPIALDDMYQYDMLGRSLANGEGFRWYSKSDVEVLRPYLEQFMPLEKLTFPDEGIETAFRAPGYPLFLSILYRINLWPNRFGLVRYVQAIMMASLTIVVIALGKSIGLSDKLSLLAGAIVSFYPMFLFYPIGLASENIFIPLLALATLLTLKIIKIKPTIFTCTALGFTLGMLILTRSVSILVAIFICVIISFTSKRYLKYIVLTILVIMTILLPWVIHHSRIMKKPSSIENSLWYNLFITNHPEGNGNFVSEIAIKPLFILDDAERDDYCKENALQFIKNDPGEAIKRVILRIPAFFGPETRVFNYFYSNNLIGNIPQPWISLVYILLSAPWFFICLFGFLGNLSIRSKSTAYITLGILALYCLPHMPITTEPRFHLAMVPLLTPMAMVGTTTLRQNWQINNSSVKRYRSLVIGIIIFFVAIWTYQIVTDLPTYIKLLSPDGNLHGISY